MIKKLNLEDKLNVIEYTEGFFDEVLVVLGVLADIDDKFKDHFELIKSVKSDLIDNMENDL